MTDFVLDQQVQPALLHNVFKSGQHALPIPASPVTTMPATAVQIQDNFIHPHSFHYKFPAMQTARHLLPVHGKTPKLALRDQDCI
jgi:hypothetical protein